jgi:putative heme-binding domain-containing protein
MGTQIASDNLRPLLRLRSETPKDDQQLVHVTRIALRNTAAATEFGNATAFNEADSRALADVALGITNATAAKFLLNFLEKYETNQEQTREFLRHAARFTPADSMDRLAAVAQQRLRGGVDLQLQLLRAIRQASPEKSARSESLKAWAGTLVEKVLNESAAFQWSHQPLQSGDKRIPWILQNRTTADDGNSVQLISSLPNGGEALTGVLQSRSFAAPAKFTFLLAGHDGPPTDPLHKKNKVELRDAEKGSLLIEAPAPRSDTAKLITWDLSQHAGKNVYLQLIDGHTGSGYAWIAAGQFSAKDLQLPSTSPRELAEQLQAAAQLAREFSIPGVAEKFLAIALKPKLDPASRVAAAEVAAASPWSAEAVAELLNKPSESLEFREQLTIALANNPDLSSKIVKLLPQFSSRVQTAIALALSSTPKGADELLKRMEAGEIPPRLLANSKLKDQIVSSRVEGAQDRIQKLGGSSDLAATQERDALIAKKKAQFLATNGSPEKGREAFNRNCANCHRIGETGALVGPQLDGLGNRGLDRILEDILDPNRNVDAAFRYQTIRTKSDDVFTGLFRREEGDSLVFSDATGKEFTVNRREVEEQRQSENSLMPDGFAEVLPEQDLHDLLAFLLQQAAR